MEERKEIVNRYNHHGLNVSKACEIAGFSRSSYYYRSNGKKRGKRPTLFTLKITGEKVMNSVVVEKIEETIGDDFIDYGYDKVTVVLNSKQYIINKKKVYRLMKENHLLNWNLSVSKTKKQYVKYRKPCPGGLFEIMEIDIKYIWISGSGRNAYLVTILDIFNRMVMVWDLAYSMNAEQIKELVD